jgi:hypothetical protein
MGEADDRWMGRPMRHCPSTWSHIFRNAFRLVRRLRLGYVLAAAHGLLRLGSVEQPP